MSETRRRWPFRLPKLGGKSSSSTPDISGQRASDASASPARAPLENVTARNIKFLQPERASSAPEEITAGSLTIHGRTEPNITSRGGMGGNAAVPQAKDTSKKIEGVGPRDGLPKSLHGSTAIQLGPTPPNTLSLDRGGKSGSSFDVSYLSSFVPYALTWTEHELSHRPTPAESLNDATDDEMTPDVFPRLEHSCTEIPGSSGEFIIFGGRLKAATENIWTNDVFLLSTIDMSFMGLVTSGAKPRAKTGHRAVVSGRALVVFGGDYEDSYLNFLTLDTREWLKLRPPAPYPGPRFGHSFIIVNKTLWMYGGAVGKNLEDMWFIDLGNEGIEYFQWQQLHKKDPWPGPLSYHSTVQYDGYLYLFGGDISKTLGPDSLSNSLWKFDVTAKTWAEVQCKGLIPPPHASHAATVIGENMFVFGGRIQTDVKDEFSRTDGAFVFNFRDLTWRSLAMLGRSPDSCQSGVLLTAGSQLVLVGGQDNKTQQIHVAETRAAGYVRDSLAKLHFTTETTKLKFTTEAIDLTHFVRKQGDSAHSLAGFSDVWKGEVTETGQPIAIKVLRVASTGSTDDPETGRLRTRFDRELTIWMECQHPRVIELLGYAYIEGVPCLISPWCSNGNIMEYISKNPNANRRRLVNQVAEGLVYLHGREPSVVHSDIKPANVLVSDEGDAQLCDFGISKLVLENSSGFTTTASVKGTLRYSSPEMLDLDGQSTTRSDVWAFGMLILHVMTNKVPYVELLSDVKVIMAIMGGQRPLPANYPQLPPTDPLWDIMGECWGSDPMKRPTITEVFDRLPKLDDSTQ